MDEQPALGTILFHVALLTIIVILVDERLIRGALAIIPAMLLAQRAIGATQAKSTDDWTGVDDRRMDVHVREHVTKLLGRFREFYAMIHLMSSGGITSEEAMERAGELEKDLNRLLGFLFDMKQGGDVFSVTQQFGGLSGVLDDTLEGRCTPVGGPTDLPGYPICDETTGIVLDGVNRVVTGTDTTYVTNTTVIDAELWWIGKFLVNEPNIIDGSYVKLREMTLSFSLPTSWTNSMNVDAVDISLVGRNLYLWSEARHIDPETSMEGTNVQGFEYGQMPSARSIGLSFTVRM